MLATAGLAVGAGCGKAATVRRSASTTSARPHWTTFVHANRPLDVVGPRRDGSMVAAAGGRLWLLRRSGSLQPFAAGYRSPGGEEPYIALSPGGCFGNGTVYALRLQSRPGVVAIRPSGRVRHFASITASGLIDGIAFDTTGHFGRRLLVTINHGSTTTVDSIGCRGGVQVITSSAPRVEGGIAVAPATFGRFAGDLIAPDEQGGRIFAVSPQGKSSLVARSGLPHGGDIGVESEAFVPNASADALVADRLTPGNPHPGDDVVLRLRAATLKAAGVRPGDLLVATEGGARTDDLRCGARSCSVRHVADGPSIAHVEGHIGFMPR